MKNTVWNAVIWKYNGDEEFRVFKHAPSFSDIYPLIDCDTIELHKGFHQDVSNRSFEMHCDEEAKLRSKPVNVKATKAWLLWAKRTGHLTIPGDTINGDIAIIKKVAKPHEQDIQSVA